MLHLGNKPAQLVTFTALLSFLIAGCNSPHPVSLTPVSSTSPSATSSNIELPPGNPTPYPQPFAQATVAYPPPGANSATAYPKPGIQGTEAISSPAVSPTAQPLLWISNISFIDAQHGWLIGAACSNDGACSLAMRITQDGGQSWQSNPAPSTGYFINGEANQTHHVRNLRFVNLKDGWAFDQGLFATHDGGRTWQDVTPDQPVIALENAGSSVWLVKGNCTENPKCAYQLLSLSHDGQTWQLLAVQPMMRGPDMQLVRAGPNDAWLLSWGALDNGSNTPYGSALVATHDGGKTWHDLPSPCANAPVFDRLAALDSNHLWALCGGLPGAGQQGKNLAVSTDGGRSWGKPVDLGGEGYFDDLAMATAQRGFIGLGRGTLLTSTDSGMTWNPAMDYATANPSDASGWRLLFLDSLHGWAALRNQVFRTVDGGTHWEETILQ